MSRSDPRVPRLDRDPQNGLGAGGAHQEAARAAELGLGLVLRVHERDDRLPLATARGLHVACDLRPELHLVGELGQVAPLGPREMQHLERRKDAVACCRVLPEDDMSGGLAPELRTASLHLLPHVAIADLSADE